MSSDICKPRYIYSKIPIIVKNIAKIKIMGLFYIYIAEDYKKVIERKNLDRIIAERIARNIRLGMDKGRYIDVDV